MLAKLSDLSCAISEREYEIEEPFERWRTHRCERSEGGWEPKFSSPDGGQWLTPRIVQPGLRSSESQSSLVVRKAVGSVLVLLLLVTKVVIHRLGELVALLWELTSGEVAFARPVLGSNPGLQVPSAHPSAPSLVLGMH